MGIKKEKEFVDKLNENIVGEEIYIWGAGQHANNLLDVLQKYMFQLDKIKGIIDSDIKKDGKSMYNITVNYKENFFNNLIKNCSDIVISSTFENEIYEELIQKTSDINIIKMHDGAIGELVDGPKYGTKGWLEQQFDNINSLGDRWGHRWRASQKLRHKTCIGMIEKYMKLGSKDLLDIGCALGDFTGKLYNVNKENRFFATDISENAINEVSKIYNQINFKVDKLPNVSFEKESFDIITCLEVLSYIKPQMDKALKNINNSLKYNGKFLVSGVNDGGKVYFAEDEFLNCVKKHFNIIEVRHCYNVLQDRLETKLLKYIYKESNKKSLKYKLYYFIVGQMWIAKLLSFLSKILFGNKGKTHTIILCEKKIKG
ncbi:methyltransferase [Clostridium botulinum]|nr:methyltransferase [Clostridium botulinum]